MLHYTSNNGILEERAKEEHVAELGLLPLLV